MAGWKRVRSQCVEEEAAEEVSPIGLYICLTAYNCRHRRASLLFVDMLNAIFDMRIAPESQRYEYTSGPCCGAVKGERLGRRHSLSCGYFVVLTSIPFRR
jgi:hypothetical protein